MRSPEKDKSFGDDEYVGVSKNRDAPKWMVKIMENPIKHGMIWGGFPIIFGNTHVVP